MCAAEGAGRLAAPPQLQPHRSCCSERVYFWKTTYHIVQSLRITCNMFCNFIKGKNCPLLQPPPPPSYPRMRRAFAALVLALILPAAQPYSAYWASSPNLGGETVTIAGAGFSAETTVRLCTDSACRGQQRHPIPPWTSCWPHSVKFVLPVTGIVPPVWAQLCEGPCAAAATAAATPAYTVPINQPEVSWFAGLAQAGAHDRGAAPMGSGVVTGGILRVFGRSLAWDRNETVCRTARARGPAPGTTLRLDGRVIAAHAATCFEASFDLQGVHAGD